MYERLNELLIQEINKSIESLSYDKTQLTDELQKYEGRKDPEKAKVENDLRKVNSELEEKKLDLEKVENINKSKSVIEIKKLEKDYQDLLKEKKDYEAEINELDERIEFNNGVIVSTKEQQEYKQDIARINICKIEISLINTSLKKIDDLKEQHKKDLEEYSETMEGLLTKYNIRQKYKSELEKEPVNNKKESTIQEGKEEKQPVSGPIHKEHKRPKPVKPEPVKQGSFIDIYSNSLPINVKSINCSIIKGKLIYTIIGLNEKGEQYRIEKNASPKKMTRQEKKKIQSYVNPSCLKDIDINLYRALNNDERFKNSVAQYTYLDYVEKMSKGYKRRDSDLKITYDLIDVKKAEMSKSQKRQIKKIAKNGQKIGVAEYIKQKGTLKSFIDKFKQKMLTAGREENIQIKGSREETIYSAYKELCNEEEFDFNKFCEDMNLSTEERKNIEAYEKVNKAKRSLFREVKSDVGISRMQPSQGNETAKKERDEENVK